MYLKKKYKAHPHHRQSESTAHSGLITKDLLSQQIVGQISVKSRPFLSDETQSFRLKLFSKQIN